MLATLTCDVEVCVIVVSSGSALCSFRLYVYMSVCVRIYVAKERFSFVLVSVVVGFFCVSVRVSWFLLG